MNKLIVIIASLVLSLISVESTQAQKSDRDQFEVQVDGLGCPFCAYGLEKKFKDFKGIKNVRIDMETGDFRFTYPAEKVLTLTDVDHKVEEAGYTAIKLKVTRNDGSIEEYSNEHVDIDIAKSNAAKATLYVAGKCNMCRARITKAVRGVGGTADVKWDVDTKILTFKYDKTITSPEEVERAVVDVGHDTKNFKADDATYAKLHSCCRYKRIYN